MIHQQQKRPDKAFNFNRMLRYIQGTFFLVFTRMSVTKSSRAYNYYNMSDMQVG